MKFIQDALASSIRHHGVGLVMSVLEGLCKAHAVQTDFAKHGLFIKIHYPLKDAAKHTKVEKEGEPEKKNGGQKDEPEKQRRTMDEVDDKDVKKDAKDDDKEGGKMEDSKDDREDVSNDGKTHTTGKKKDKKGEAKEFKMDDEKVDKEIGKRDGERDGSASAGGKETDKQNGKGGRNIAAEVNAKLAELAVKHRRRDMENAERRSRPSPMTRLD